MRLLGLLVLVISVLAGYCYDLATAGTADQAVTLKAASKLDDKAHRYLKGDSEELTAIEDEERGGLERLKSLFRKSPSLDKLKTQAVKPSDLNKAKAAVKDPEIAKMKNLAGKVELTSRDAKCVRAISVKNPLRGLNLIEKLIAIASIGFLVGGFGFLIAMIVRMLSADKK
ncbi:hypothetical protein GN244_ATG11853 [Phytophthora infestans]|uniref:Secreted RxLR effector peptide protein n=1 Tax=Phytophthora infestans TaxID=4787 RepID=A0A833T3B7_PHYIN|nr:hypothetical protein GN244_ATG11853 [Phytophthora infestans]KAF4137589.1 hypothetical protein GN958_ATG13215 [Phytophthora infestans]